MYKKVKIWDKKTNTFSNSVKNLKIKEETNYLTISFSGESFFSTGLIDSENKEIFEGDIVEVKKYYQIRVYIVLIEEGSVKLKDFYTTDPIDYVKEEIKVIGNIKEDGDIAQIILKNL